MKRAEHLQKGHGGNTSYRTTSATEAKELLNEARGNIDINSILLNNIKKGLRCIQMRLILLMHHIMIYLM